MKYGIVENHKFILIDDNLVRLRNTLEFMPQCLDSQIKEYKEEQVEQGYDGVWYEKGYAPEKPIEQARSEKLVVLEAVFESASKQAHCLSSVGFEIDADDKADRNIRGLLVVTPDEETVLFRAYDDTFHKVTGVDLKTMLKDIVNNGNALYQKKWQIESAINAAETVAELEAIDISFK